jgi:hypothetical protein
MKKLLSFIGRIIYRRTEYVYVYEIPSDEKFNYDNLTLEEVKKLANNIKAGNKLEQFKTQVINYIKKDLNNKNRNVEFSDFLTDFNSGQTYYIFASQKENPFFVPLFYEIYAYTKLKDSSKFSYKFQTLIFNQITILKFKVKCYGKKS